MQPAAAAKTAIPATTTLKRRSRDYFKQMVEQCVGQRVSRLVVCDTNGGASPEEVAGWGGAGRGGGGEGGGGGGGGGGGRGGAEGGGGGARARGRARGSAAGGGGAVARGVARGTVSGRRRGLAGEPAGVAAKRDGELTRSFPRGP